MSDQFLYLSSLFTFSQEMTSKIIYHFTSDRIMESFSPLKKLFIPELTIFQKYF
jgi:hypothetical protein